MSHRHLLHRFLSVLVLVSLLSSTLAPVARAQDGGVTYLPLIASAKQPSNPSTNILFRTQVTVKTSAQWRDLARLGVTILQQGDDWALLLVDDDQLESLAAWRFNPERTSDLGSLAAANGLSDASLSALLTQADAVQQLAAAETSADAASLHAARADLSAAMHNLPATVQASLVTADEPDRDHDGLTDTQEGWWCTNADIYDSDSDGTGDGAEVAKLKAWMSHQLALPPIDTAQPFNGWPFDNVNCIDNDRDSVPNLAERWELGLNMNIESTDRDRYDDGQEVYGTTYCPGSGNACGYGQLPSANHDGILLFPQLPSWVTAPGNHPLVAAFPKIEIDIIADAATGKTFQMRLATVLTTDERHEEGETKSYSTTKTEGTSTSNAETETWEDWQEVSRTDAASVQVASAEGTSNSTVNIIESTNINTTNVMQNLTQMTVNLSKTAKSIPHVYLAGKATEAADFALGEVCAEIHCKRYAGAAIRTAIRAPVAAWDQYQKNVKSNQCEQGLLGTLKCAWSATASAVKMTWEQKLDEATKAEQDARGQVAGTDYATGNGMLDSQKIYPISYPMPSFVPTVTNTSGSSRGGARTTTHTQYEEHSVTEGNTKQFGRSWGTATAENTVHTADLWFAYQVRNGGTDYARSICNVAFNVFIGSLDVPAVTYFPAADFGGNGCLSNFRPGEAHKYTFPTQSRIALTIDQVKAIDLGEPVHITVEDMSLGQDDYYADDAVLHDMTFSMEDGTDDGDELIDTYLIPTWTPGETVLNVLARYFPHTTDANGMMTAIWTPEYRSDTPAWCQSPRRPTDYFDKVLWCKHELSTAEWWNVYTDGLGDGGEGFQDTPAAPSSMALFRFNQDSDLDGFSDRSEERLGTDANDATSFPKPEVLAGIYNIKAGSRVTSTLSLLNTGFYDAYGVEAVMVAPDDSVSIDNNTVGGSGRVRAQKQVIVGSRIIMQQIQSTVWNGTNSHAVPAVGGYYTGSADRTYTFSVANCPVGGCTVGSGTWTLNWSDGKGATGSLNFGAGYASPTFLPVGAFGVTLALYTGNVQDGESFSVAANTPRDTFQYTINRTPHTEPLVIVSYNDPQGNHRFVVPTQAMSLTAPTDNLQLFAGQMLDDVGVELVTSAPFDSSLLTHDQLQLLVNNPSDKTLVDAHLFLEFINISGTVVSEVPTQATLPPGPTYTQVTWSTADFDPAFDPDQDYIVMAFLTDYQGNILDTAGRPLSSFQEDPLPQVAADPTALTWDFGSVAQGSLLKHPLALANVGHGALYAYMQPTPGLHLSRAVNASVGAADQSDFELTLRTTEVAVGAYDQVVTIHTSDPATPTVAVHVVGTIAAATGDTTGGSSRPLDWPVTVTGPKNQGEWAEFTHTLGPQPQTLHPCKVYGADYATMHGVGKYCTDFGAGTASAAMFGDGSDGPLTISSNTVGDPIDSACSGTAGSYTLSASNGSFTAGQKILIHQTQGSSAGNWEINEIVDYSPGTIALTDPLRNNYSSAGGNKAQVLVLKEYTDVTVASGTTWTAKAWNGTTGGILAFLASGTVSVVGAIGASGTTGSSSSSAPSTPAGAIGGGFRGGAGRKIDSAGTATQGEGVNGPGISSQSANSNGGGGGTSNTTDREPIAGGGGGSHATSGVQGTVNDPSGAPSGPKGSGGAGATTISGSSDLTYMVFGGGGGGGNLSGPTSNKVTYGGASGGGIIFISAAEIDVAGSVSTNGGSYGSTTLGFPMGGSGAGGSILVTAQTAALGMGRVTAIGGPTSVGDSGGQGSGGAGGDGRIHVEYCNSLFGITSPIADTHKLNCYVTEQVESIPYDHGRLNLPENVTSSKTYQVQYGRKLNFITPSEQITKTRIPASMLTTATLDALVSQLPADASFSLDIGNDGSNDWTTTVANNSTNASPNLAAAFNAYWQSHGAPTTGTLDVPVRVTLSQAGQVLLTNLQVTTAGSKLRAMRLPAQSYSTVNLDFTVGGSGATPLTVALDVGGDGSIDWSDSAESLPFAFETGNLATAVNAYLAGKSGEVDVPLRIHVSPDAPITLNDFTTAVATSIDLTANTISVPPPVGQASNLTSAANEIWAANASALSSYRAGDIAPVAATLGNTGNRDSGPVTAAFFATAEGWGDWYIGSDFFANIPSGGSVQAEILWDTTGFSGTTPVKVVVNPYGRVAESDSGDNVKTTSVFIEPPVPPPAVGFAAAPTSGALPLTVQFTDTSDSQAPITAWQWDFGDGGTSSQQHPLHTYTTAGLYTVTLTVSTASDSGTATRGNFIAVNVPLPPLANFSASATAGSAPLSVQFMDQSDGLITSRQWNFGDGVTSTEVNPLHIYATSGNYTATLTVTGPGGSSSKTVGITVSPAQVSVSIPLTVGWNLISLPNVAANTPVESVFAPIAGKFNIVFAYQGCDASNPFDPWKKYAPTAPSFSNDLKTVDNTLGLWIEMTQAATLTVVGPPPTGGSMPLCVGQNDGWNLVGYPALQTAAPATLFAPILGCLDIVFAYRGMDADHWKKYSPTALPFSNDLTQVAPGDGLWVRVTQACTWTVGGP